MTEFDSTVYYTVAVRKEEEGSKDHKFPSSFFVNRQNILYDICRRVLGAFMDIHYLANGYYVLLQ